MQQDSENIVHQHHNESLDELRELILGLSPNELAMLHSWLKSKDKFTEEIGRILPKAVQISLSDDSPLATILLPVVEQAIFSSVQNNPKVLADALFPVMGAAIRKSISDTFREMIQSLNETLENNFSFERVKWRLEAVFSSKSFGEIVLLKGVKYSVKSVFLVHKETGLLIQDAYSTSDHADEADMVSSMLTAVQDFVKDSFSEQLHTSDTLDTIKLNDFNVWIEDGPLAYMAMVIEGSPPETVRHIFKENLEELHGKFSSTLSNFEGDSLDGIPLKPFLNNCLINQEFYKEEKSHLKAYLALAVITILLATWAFFSYQKQHQWDGFISGLKAEKSIVILESGFNSDGYFVSGMKDALQSDFGKIALENDIDSTKITYHWVNYYSLEPEFVYLRMLRKFNPESTVTTALHSDTIQISGKASQTWINSITTFGVENAQLIHLDSRGLSPKEADSIAILQNEFANYQLQFSFGATYLKARDKEVLKELTEKYKQFKKFAPYSNIKIVVTPDTVGVASENIRFAKKRYQSAYNYFVSNGILESEIKLEIKSNTGGSEPRVVGFVPVKLD